MSRHTWAFAAFGYVTVASFLLTQGGRQKEHPVFSWSLEAHKTDLFFKNY